MADLRGARSTPRRTFLISLVTAGLSGCTQVARPNPASTAPPAPPAAGAVSAFLAELSEAIAQPARWGKLLDATDPGFEEVATRLRQSLAAFRVELIPQGRVHPLPQHRAALFHPSARAHAVRIRWALPAEPVSAEHVVWLTLTNTALGPRLAGTTDGPAGQYARPSWWSVPMQVHTSDTASVIAAPRIDPQPWLAGLHTATATLARHGLRTSPLVAEIPATAAEFERVLGVPAGSHRRVAATAWPAGPAARIVVNPEIGGALSGPARQVLLTHEAVHVASGSVHQPIPLWLAEGYADLVALSDQPEVSASHLSRLVEDQRRHGVAEALLTEAELAPDHPRVHANYQRAWVTAAVLDRGNGAAGRVHTAVVAGEPLGSAVAAEGWNEARLSAAVRAELRRLVG